MKKPGYARRAAVLVAAPVVVGLAVLTAQSAAADVKQGGELVAGKGVVARITTKDTSIAYTFAATKGLHVTFSTSATNWGTGAATWNLYTPDGNWADWWYINKDPQVYDFTPNSTGTWKLVLTPLDNAVGSATMTYAPDVVAGPVAPNTSTTLENTVRGQNMVVKFTGTKGQHVSLDVTASKINDGKASGKLFMPDGTYADTFEIDDVPTFYDFTPTVDGEWRLVVDPEGFAKGKTSVTVAPDLVPVALTDGKPVTTTIKSRGQNASLTFSATATTKTKIPFNVTATNWGKGSAKLFFYQPDGKFYDQCTLTTKPVTCTLYPAQSGNWKIVVDPQADATGTATVTKTKAVPVTTAAGKVVTTPYHP